MARKKRRCEPNTMYHVFSRSCQGKNIMWSPKVKALLISCFKMGKHKYNFELLIHSLLDNHFHAIIRTVDNGETISLIMQFIKSQFARRYNKMHNTFGPVWNERFGSRIIFSANDCIINKKIKNIKRLRRKKLSFFRVLMYIAYNAVKKGYVKDPREYKYCSINAYFDKDHVPDIPLDYHPFYLELGSTFEERREQLIRFEKYYRSNLYRDFSFT